MDSFWATLDVQARGAFIETLSQSLDVFTPVAKHEYYASKMGHAGSFWGKGLAKVML